MNKGYHSPAVGASPLHHIDAQALLKHAPPHIWPHIVDGSAPRAIAVLCERHPGARERFARWADEVWGRMSLSSRVDWLEHHRGVS